ncbi:hypothetical protein O7627_31735 [Solwaraspora sp. WMMD1047]|uniref:hypothetical protein n=1 Tax=Solwaraspora sp. WMMD1047 TaxID=3016102 RepID=UPI002417B5E6|nr:hypothetical protein [Solwaraspora sp. WMMD1047]MDG4833848.1 hypothetical protein [Solwaraspora sp. WMMD1047]
MRTPIPAPARSRLRRLAGAGTAAGVLVAATLALSWPVPVSAAATTTPDQQLAAAPAASLFTDDFEDGDAAGWTRGGGFWSVLTEDNTRVYRQRSTRSASRVTAGEAGWTDYSVTARVKPTALGTASSSVALLARVQSNTSYYYLSLRSGSLELGRVSSGQTTVLASTPATATLGGWHQLRLAVQGSTITGALGTASVTATDGQFSSGRIGLATTSASGSFDDIVVDPPAPPPDTQRPTIPGQPQVIEVTPTTATIIWTPSTDNVGVTQYWIYQGDQFYSQWVSRMVPTAEPTVLPLSPTGASLHFSVAARDAAGNMSAISYRTYISQPPSFPRSGDETERPTAPGAPEVTGVTADGQLTLTWTPATDNVGVVEYHVIYTYYVDETRVAAKVPTNTATIQRRGGAPQLVRIVAFDAAWNSSSSPSVSLENVVIPTPPATPG